MQRQRPDDAATHGDRKSLCDSGVDDILVTHINGHRHRVSDSDGNVHEHGDTHLDRKPFCDSDVDDILVAHINRHRHRVSDSDGNVHQHGDADRDTDGDRHS